MTDAPSAPDVGDSSGVSTRASAHPAHRAWRWAWTALTPVLGLTGAAGVGSETVPVDDIVQISPILVLLIVVTWRERRSWTDQRETFRWLALGVLGFLVGALVGGAPLGAALWAGLADTVCAAVFCLVYRWGGRNGGWVPRRPSAAIAVLVAAGVAAIVGALLGAFPGTQLGVPHDIRMTIWAVLRTSALLTVAAYCVFPWILPAAASALPRMRGPLALHIVGAGVCEVLPYAAPDMPLSWLFVVPGVMGGLALRQRGATLAVLVLAVIFVRAPYPAVVQSYPDSPVPPQALVELTLAFAALLATVLVLFREESAAMDAETARQQELELSQNLLLTSVLHAMGDGVLLTDPEGRVALSNPAATQLVGSDIPDAMTLEWIRRIDLQTADVDAVLGSPPLRTFLRPGRHQVDQDVTIGAGQDGRPGRRLSVTSRLMELGGDGLTLILFRDVSREHARQKELEAFAGTVAHDLKGPLTALAGWVEAGDEELEAGDLDSSLAAVRRAQEASQRMSSLIDDYLAYAVSRGGELTLTEVDLTSIANEVVEVYTGGERGAVFEVATPHVLRADAALTRQLMANLIGNGVKYSRPGEPPYISVSSLDEAPGWARVEVADRGRGLEPGDELRIFDAFGRSAKDAGSVQGIGLGLALCHAIVTRHGGRIWAANNEHGGATISFTMPTPGVLS